MPKESQGKFRSPQNTSGSSQHNIFAATPEVDGELF